MNTIQDKILKIISELKTEKQRQFVLELVNNGFNGTKAAVAAGYSPKTAETTASENQRKPKVRQAIEEIKKLQTQPLIEATAKKCLTKADIFDIWAEIANDKDAGEQARLKATELMAKTLCLFPKENEIKIDNTSNTKIDPEELQKIIKKVIPEVRKKCELPKNITEIEEKRKKWGI